MEWTESHDVLLGREILLVRPFQVKKGSPKRGLLWQEIADNLNRLDKPSFKVKKRAVRERYTLLADKFKKRMNEETKASGISPDELSELDRLLQEIIDLEAEDHENVNSNEAALAADKTKAYDMRMKALEKLGETCKRKLEETDEAGETTERRREKKKRTSGSETIAYLREKNEIDKQLRKREMEIKQKEVEANSHIMQATLQLQQMLQQQQQQNAAMMLMLQKLMSN